MSSNSKFDPDSRPHHEGFISWALRSSAQFGKLVIRAIIAFAREILIVLQIIGRSIFAPLRGRTKLPPISVESVRKAANNAVRIPREARRKETVFLDQSTLEGLEGNDRARVRRRERKRIGLTRKRTHLVLLIGVLVSGLFAWHVLPSADIFKLRHVEVIGASSVSDLDVRMRIDPTLVDRTIYEVDSERVSALITELPFVRKASVERHFPSGISIHVSEYRPLALGFSSGDKRWWLVAPDGQVLAASDPAEWISRIPMVSLDASRPEAGKKLKDEPAIQLLRQRRSDSTLSFVQVQMRPNMLTAQIQNGIEVRFGRPELLRTKLMTAERLLFLANRRGEKVSNINVAVPDRATYCTVGAVCASQPAIPLKKRSEAPISEESQPEASAETDTDSVEDPAADLKESEESLFDIALTRAQSNEIT